MTSTRDRILKVDKTGRASEVRAWVGDQLTALIYASQDMDSPNWDPTDSVIGAKALDLLDADPDFAHMLDMPMDALHAVARMGSYAAAVAYGIRKMEEDYGKATD